MWPRMHNACICPPLTRSVLNVLLYKCRAWWPRGLSWHSVPAEGASHKPTSPDPLSWVSTTARVWEDPLSTCHLTLLNLSPPPGKPIQMTAMAHAENRRYGQIITGPGNPVILGNLAKRVPSRWMGPLCAGTSPMAHPPSSNVSIIFQLTFWKAALQTKLGAALLYSLQ